MRSTVLTRWFHIVTTDLFRVGDRSGLFIVLPKNKLWFEVFLILRWKGRKPRLMDFEYGEYAGYFYPVYWVKIGAFWDRTLHRKVFFSRGVSNCPREGARPLIGQDHPEYPVYIRSARASLRAQRMYS